MTKKRMKEIFYEMWKRLRYEEADVIKFNALKSMEKDGFITREEYDGLIKKGECPVCLYVAKKNKKGIVDCNECPIDYSYVGELKGRCLNVNSRYNRWRYAKDDKVRWMVVDEILKDTKWKVNRRQGLNK